MSKPRLAVAAGSALGTQAATEVARAGGNAVDACLAAAITAWVAEPFFASIGGSGFIAIGAPDGSVEVIDGNNMMPFTSPREKGQGITRIFLPDYADGIYMGIGAGSVGVPGILAAAHLAWTRHGRIGWPALFSGAIAAARDGISFPRTSDYYLSCTWDTIWSRYEETRAIFGPEGTPMKEAQTLRQPELAEALEMVAQQGPDVFYRGELADEICAVLAKDDGFLARADLESYEAEIRAPIQTTSFGWDVWSNPPPAVGGATLVHMLALLQRANMTEPVERLRAVVEAQRAATGYRKERYEDPDSVAAAFDEALSSLRSRSEDTTHSSAADADGYVCAITESNGYGAGLSVHGMLLNNTLGEEELNPRGFHRLPPGSRCHSNMAPTIVQGDGRKVALGSPGADRIVGAIAQTFLALAVDGLSLPDAVGAPRAHLDARQDGERLCYEPGLPGDALTDYVQRPYEEPHMYFGAVQAAAVGEDGGLEAAHDPRRSGGSALV